MTDNKITSRPRVWLRRIFGAAILIGIGLVGGFWIWGGATVNQPMDTGSAGEHVHGEREVVSWTCAMHPQIRQPKPGQCPICGMDLIPVSTDASGDMAGLRRFTTSPAGLELMDIQMVPVSRRFVETEVQMVGKVAYDETKLAYISAWVPGRIDRMYVDYTGITVNEGDHMVYLYSPEILTAYEELKRAAASVKSLSQGSSDVMRSTMQSNLEASREKLRRWGLTQAQIREAEEKGITSDHITIYSPLSGTVIHRNGQEGMYVQTGTPIYTIADMSEMWVMLDAYESDLVWLKFGQEVEMTTEAYPGDAFTGKISFIEPYLNKVTRTVKVRVHVPNEDRRLKPEMFVHATARSKVALGGRVMDPEMVGKWISPMHPEIVKDGPGTCDICGMALVPAKELGYVEAGHEDEARPLVIPITAALVTGRRAIVYVSVPGQDKPTFEGREIVLGPRAGEHYIVRAGLDEGELVVTNGNFKIDSALQILAKPSMMTPEGGGGGGHDHGGRAAGPSASEGGAAQEVTLDFKSKEQLEQIFSAYAHVEELDPRSDAYADAVKDIETAIENVDMSLLTGHAHMVWMEYMRRLLNDVAEAKYAVTAEDSDEALTQMKEDLNTLGRQLGVGPNADHAAHASKIELSAEVEENLRTAIQHYLDMQEELAADSTESIAEHVKAMRDSFANVDEASVPLEALASWNAVADSLDGVDASEDIKVVRMAFGPVSDAILALMESVTLSIDAPLYRVHCPMAFDGQGGDWLQRNDEVLNPYYGSMMLNCGSITNRFAEEEGPPQETNEAETQAEHEGQQHD